MGLKNKKLFKTNTSGQTPGDGWGTEKPGVLQPMGSQRGGHDLVIEKQQLNRKIST